MKIALLAIHTLVCFITQAQTADTLAREVILLNDREIALETLLLVNPKKINGIHVSYPLSGINQYQIDAKQIKFLQYDDLKVCLGLTINATPQVYVDGKSYPNKDEFEIDQSFIKKIDYLNGNIRVLTKRKKTKTSSICYGVRIPKPTGTAHFPKPEVVVTDERFIN